MLGNNFIALSPLLLLAGSSVLIMLLIALKLSHRTIQFASLFLFVLAFSSLFYAHDLFSHPIEPLLIVDRFSLFIMGLIIFSGLIVNILSYIYFEEKEESPKEYYVLLFLCTLGACVLAVSKHFISLFLGLEILTVGLYGLIAYLRARHYNIEAGIKYLILAAFSSAFLLFGMALIYLQTGSMEFLTIGQSLHSLTSLPPLFLTGLGLMLVGIGFKLAVVPFHMWTADIYQGAPTPVTGFIATVSKGGVLAVLLRFFIEIDGFRFKTLMLILISIAVVSMIIGNLLALQQKNVKRILAYSSIAHLGYLLVALIPGSTMSLQSVCFYLVVYVITILTAFGILIILSTKENDADDIESYKGLFWKHPLLACIFSVALLSLAGIPLTAGFVGKFLILAANLQAGFWLTAFVLVISSVIGLYYYLRIISKMFSGRGGVLLKEKRAYPIFYLISVIVLLTLTLFIILFGTYPSGLMYFVAYFQFK
ncbi:NADH-quinone oxidoreductase subunit N [Olivibacter domesticus]|uniref:NADH-quinone oxidoreductase subunit N n=1 Tax=Olivibacter domesticus TaxID=407022 RepID=A0A1H7MS64_OLID1|nr:NADH-quinone oxidoreductase subunit N [Olivibacter domesticus]SEL13648.1 NADH dehydrogenase subunit N [Olivibacter domesticus]